MYYQIRPTSDPKVIGVKNGVHQGEIRWNKFDSSFDAEQIQTYFSLDKYRSNHDVIEPFNFEIKYVQSYVSARLTDFYSFTPRLWGIDFFVTTEVKSLLERFFLPTHAFVPVKIFHKGKVIPYWGFYLPRIYKEDSIDFKKSTFLKEVGGCRTVPINFEDAAAYQQNPSVSAEIIALNNNFDPNLDLFSTWFNEYGYYVSTRLRNALVKSEFNGFEWADPPLPGLAIS